MSGTREGIRVIRGEQREKGGEAFFHMSSRSLERREARLVRSSLVVVIPETWGKIASGNERFTQKNRQVAHFSHEK